MRSVHIEHLRPGEILEAQRRRSLVYLPLGPLEWHGPAMPFGTDPMAAAETARRAALRTGGVVMPTLYCGTERERSPQMLEAMGFEDTGQYIVGQDFPCNSVRSFYAREEVFALIVREHLRLLADHGYRLIVIVSGHGADNQRIQLERLAAEFSNETESQVMALLGIAPLDESDRDGGHATRLETSVQMALHPENVDLGELPPRNVKLRSCDWGIDDGCTFQLCPNEDKTVIFDPRDATAALGEQYLLAAENEVVRQVRERWNLLFPGNPL